MHGAAVEQPVGEGRGADPDQQHEGATDGSHPNDLGFLRQADAFEPIIKKALKGR